MRDVTLRIVTAFRKRLDDASPFMIVAWAASAQAARMHHGRPWQALCLWSSQVIATLATEGHPIAAGSAGENVTVSGIDWATMRAGTIIDLGDVRCQLSGPAEPCSKNARWFVDGDYMRMDHQRHLGSSRWYASVLHPGVISVGDPVTISPP